MIKHRIVRDLLRDAEALARQDRHKPRETSLRRAVSNAYYAVFHALCYLTADGLVGWVEWERFAPLYRSLDHRDIETKLNKDARELHPSVARVAAAFRQLQEQRHKADYDPRPLGLGRDATLKVVATAREAVDLIETLPAPVYRQLAVILIAKKR